MSENNIPKGWNSEAHAMWEKRDINSAIEKVVALLNTNSDDKKPKPLLMQLAFYFYLTQNYESASTVFKDASAQYPEDEEILLNAGICLSKADQPEESIKYISQFLKKSPRSFAGWDCLTHNYAKMNEMEKASRSGTNSLLIKDKNSGEPPADWSLPSEDKAQFTHGKKKVIAFSLWGNHPRYIYGALRNLLLAPDLYPGWEIWIYTDKTVPEPFIDIFQYLGATIYVHKGTHDLQERLSWRFNVANHEDVGLFLVRDIDSVFSLREAQAVQEWIASDKWFHVIRDWWTHTDLMLAGMWGGIAGVLPNLAEMIKNYSITAAETPNIDQWFLRDCVWRYVKKSCLVHDRCFNVKEAAIISGPEPEGNIHIGNCEYLQDPEFQKKILSPWIGNGNHPKILRLE